MTRLCGRGWDAVAHGCKPLGAKFWGRELPARGPTGFGLAVTAAFDASALLVIRTSWAARLAIPPEFFDAGGPHLVQRAEADAVIGVELGGATVVLAPPRPLAALRALQPGHLMNMAALVGALHSYRPKAVGMATLSFAHASETSLRLPRAGDVSEATTGEAEQVLAACTTYERQESGLDEMPAFCFVAHARDGAPAAVAGYEIWAGRLAHLGVLVHPRYRRQGFASAAAAAAANAGLNERLLPQWRCRSDNLPSHALSERLGFVTLGRQLAIRLQT